MTLYEGNAAQRRVVGHAREFRAARGACRKPWQRHSDRKRDIVQHEKFPVDDCPICSVLP